MGWRTKAEQVATCSCDHRGCDQLVKVPLEGCGGGLSRLDWLLADYGWVAVGPLLYCEDHVPPWQLVELPEDLLTRPTAIVGT